MNMRARKGMSYPAVIETENHEEIAYMIESHQRSPEAILKLAHKMAAADELLIGCETALTYLKLSTFLEKQELMLFLEETIKKARGES